MNKPTDNKFSISLNLALQLFPFVMCIDSTGNIKYCSERLRSQFKFNPLNKNLFELFEVQGAGKRAQQRRQLSSSNIDELFLLVNQDQGIGLRGQLIEGMYDNKAVFLFVCTPWLSWMYDNIEKPKVDVKDFPVIDSQLEYQMNLCANSEMLKDLKLFSAKLEQSKINAEAASLAKTKFVRHVSHEIRTPLNGLITALGLMQDGTQAHRKARLFEIANSSAKALLDLVSDVLDFSRLEDGVFASIKEKTKISQLILEIEAALSAKAAEKEISLQFDLSLTVPSAVYIDKRSLQRILFNLISNAIKYSQSDLVVVRVVPVQDRLRFEVEDFGVGLSTDELSMMFDPFWVSDRNSPNEQSTGLGLTIVKETIEKLDGSLDVDSMPGQGTRFRFELPLVDLVEEEHTTNNVSVDTPTEISIYKGSVLLVDDNSVNLELAQIQLRKLGLEVTTAFNGEEAVLAEAANNFDLIFMDIRMPVLNGIDAARKIRKCGKNSRIPIVAMTANVSSLDCEEYREAGMSDFIAKPVDSEKLRGVISQFLPLKSQAEPVQELIDSQLNNNLEDVILEVGTFTTLVDNVGADNIRRIFEMYRDETDRQLTELDEAVRAEEYNRVQSIAHRIASSTLSFGLNKLGYMLRKLEADVDSRHPIPLEIAEELKDCYGVSITLLEDACPPAEGNLSTS